MLMHLRGVLVFLALLEPAVAWADGESWKALFEAGGEAYRRANYIEAEREFAAAVKEAEAFGENDPRLPESLLGLAQSYRQQGRWGRAERLCLRAQPLLEKLHGHSDVKVARCLNERARIYHCLGLIDEAENLARRALGISEKALGKDHPDTAAAVETLAALGRAYERFEGQGVFGIEYLPVRQRTLEVREKALGKESVSLVPSLLVLAAQDVHGFKPSQEQAEQDLRRALAITTKAGMPEHPDAAECFTLLAQLYQNEGKYREAEQVQVKALAIWKKVLGDNHPKVGLGLASLAAIRLGQGRRGETEALLQEALRSQFSGLDDEELCAYSVRADLPDAPFDPGNALLVSLNHREAYLSEMIRRGGKFIETFLAKAHEEALAKRQKDPAKAPSNLDLLTALRRARKSPDPLAVRVNAPTECECIFPRLPDFHVAIVNQDVEGALVGIQEWGDYRSGRQARWRFDVLDKNGNPMALKTKAFGEGGGISRPINLELDHSWDTTLHMNRFLDLAPGDYTVSICYHDRRTIADYPHTVGLITSRSAPIRLHVQPRVIDIGMAEREEVRKWVDRLDDKAEVKFLVGAADNKEAHDFILAESPPGRLLALGWKAVPPLIDELANDHLTVGKRAWLLALLFSLTGQNDPRDAAGVLGKASYLEVGWVLHGGLDGKMTMTGASSSITGNATVPIDEVKQRAFAKRWQAFRQFIIVREP
jgi:tetratricopeptide (TPR) repeat protein